MYRKGELKITVPPCEEAAADPDGTCFSDEHAHTIFGDPKAPVGTAFLPHSCDEWVIGGKEQIQELIDDLLAVLDKMN